MLKHKIYLYIVDNVSKEVELIIVLRKIKYLLRMWFRILRQKVGVQYQRINVYL